MADSSVFLVEPDDFCLALFSEEGSLPITDENYAEELQLQEVIMSPLESSLLLPHTTTSHLSKDRATPMKADLVVIAETGESSEVATQKEADMVVYITEKGESSGMANTKEADRVNISETVESSGIFCQICVEGKPEEEMFRSEKCSHVFCSDCISKHIAVKIQQNITAVECPDLDCKGLLEPEFCRRVIPAEVFERWENALFESMILEGEKFYCPFKDCSALLADDGGLPVTQSECPYCHRLFCAQCMVPWHAGFECLEFQSLNRDERGSEDLTAMELAKNSRWKRCSRCKFYVEKTDGCQHIVCRCGFEFCYGCGALWDNHGGCAST